MCSSNCSRASLTRYKGTQWCQGTRTGPALDQVRSEFFCGRGTLAKPTERKSNVSFSFTPASTGASHGTVQPFAHRGRGRRRPPRALSSKGRQTRQAIEDAARKLFAERGFHGTTLVDITSAAGRSPPAVFYRYYDDKEDLLAALADSFLHDVVLPSGLRLHLPESPDDTGFFRHRRDRVLGDVQTEHRHHGRRRPARRHPAAIRSPAKKRVPSVRHRHRRGVGAARPGARLRGRLAARAHRAGDRAAVRTVHDRMSAPPRQLGTGGAAPVGRRCDHDPVHHLEEKRSTDIDR